MAYKMQKMDRDRPHKVSCTEHTYYEAVKVVDGVCNCERKTTMLHLRSRGYVEVKEPETKPAEPKPAAKKKPAKKKAAKKPKPAPKEKDAPEPAQ